MNELEELVSRLNELMITPDQSDRLIEELEDMGVEFHNEGWPYTPPE